MQVEVYYHIRKRVWSVRSCATGKVLLHTNHLKLADVKFIVQPAGRAKVLREQCKNVHAFVRGKMAWWQHGTVTEAGADDGIDDYCERRTDIFMSGWPKVKFSYNPYRYDSFMALHGDTCQPAYSATGVEMLNKTVWLAKKIGEPAMYQPSEGIVI